MESDVSKNRGGAQHRPRRQTDPSQSLEGVSSVVIQFNLNVKINDAANDVREKLARIKPDLPTDARIRSSSASIPPTGRSCSLALSSDSMSLRDLTELADEDMRKRLENVPGVGKVTLVGGAKREIEILPDPARLMPAAFAGRCHKRPRRATSICSPAASSEPRKRRRCASPAECAMCASFRSCRCASPAAA